MSSYKYVTIQKAANNIAKSIYFSKRWCRSSSLVEAISKRYKLANILVNTKSLSMAMSKLEPFLSDSQQHHTTGIYRGYRCHKAYYYFQGKSCAPPFTPPANDKTAWSAIDGIDDKMLQEYLENNDKFRNHDRIIKKRRLDDVDIIDNQTITKIETDRIICKNREESRYVITSTYWDSTEAKILFRPKENETVLNCLRRREEILLQACLSDEIMLELTSGSSPIDELSSKQKEHLRYQCLYLRKAYEIAIQFMSAKTWTECIIMAISELADIGIQFIKNEKTVRQWHTIFKNNECFNIAYVRQETEPKVFTFFPQVKGLIKKYCNEKVKSGELSTEGLHAELNTKIIPSCYNDMLNDADASLRDEVPSYKELLLMLDLKSVCMSTVFNWMRDLGYRYDVNMRSYYTDGHERTDVVLDREQRFLDSYFGYEIDCHRWVQIEDSEAKMLEKQHIGFPTNCYHEYACNEKSFREYHIDCHNALLSYVDED